MGAVVSPTAIRVRSPSCDTAKGACAFSINGLFDTGYKYMTIDDGWQQKPVARGPDGRLRADERRYPCDDVGTCGIKRLAVDLHNMGFKIGIYSDSGHPTCGGNNGSLGHEQIDADTFASWGVDYLKYDNCCIPEELQDNPNWCGSGKPRVRKNKHCPKLVNNHTCTVPKGYDWKESHSYNRYNNMSIALQNARINFGQPIMFAMCILGTADVTS